MSVRQRRWTNEEGHMQEAWYIDVKQRVPGRGLVRVRQASPINSRRSAESHERNVRLSILDGSWFQKEEVAVSTLGEFVEQFLTYSENNNKFSTLESKRALLRLHVVPFFGAMRLDAIGTAEVETFKAAMKKKASRARELKPDASRSAVLRRYGPTEAKELSPKTINNALACLRKLLSLAEEHRIIRHMPRVRLFKTAESAFDFLDFDEAERLVDAFAKHEAPLLAAVLLATKAGLRLGELQALQWCDVDLIKARVHIRRNIYRGRINETPKGGKTRFVDVPPSVVNALKAIRHLKTWIFCNERGDVLEVKAFNAALNRAVRRAGIAREEGRIGWHDLRHTYASHLAMRGVTMRTIQELLGHSSITTTMRYAHLSPSVTRAAVHVLDERPPCAVGAHAGHKPADPPEHRAESAS